MTANDNLYPPTPADTELFVGCDCHTEGLWLTYSPEDRDLYVALMSYRPQRAAWRWRWHLIRRIIRVGYPYPDEVILSLESVRRLKAFCEEVLR